MRATWIAACFAVMGAASLVGCKPKPGSDCKTEGEAQCDGKGALVCSKGTWMHTECRGPAACTVSGSTINCDQSVAELDDACAQEGGYACSTDASKLLICKAGKFTQDEVCTGSSKCTSNATHAGCE